MATLTKTKKTANTTGYVVALPTGGVGSLTVGCESGECWVRPVVGATTTPATPTSAAVPAAAGDEVDYIHLTANQSREFSLAGGYAADNQRVRYTHLLIYSVTGGLIEYLGA